MVFLAPATAGLPYVGNHLETPLLLVDDGDQKGTLKEEWVLHGEVVGAVVATPLENPYGDSETWYAVAAGAGGVSGVTALDVHGDGVVVVAVAASAGVWDAYAAAVVAEAHDRPWC